MDALDRTLWDDLDGEVGLADFSLLKENFGAVQAVPEPTTLLLAALAGLMCGAGGLRDHKTNFSAA